MNQSGVVPCCSYFLGSTTVLGARVPVIWDRDRVVVVVVVFRISPGVLSFHLVLFLFLRDRDGPTVPR